MVRVLCCLSLTFQEKCYFIVLDDTSLLHIQVKASTDPQYDFIIRHWWFSKCKTTMYTKVHYERLIVATAHRFGDDVAVVQSTIYNGYQVFSSLLLSTDSICSSFHHAASAFERNRAIICLVGGTFH